MIGCLVAYGHAQVIPFPVWAPAARLWGWDGGLGQRHMMLHPTYEATQLCMPGQMLRWCARLHMVLSSEAVMSSKLSRQCRFGVWGEWDQPYMTLEPAYEAAQLRVFGRMVARQHVYRGRKPVHWSPSSQTALAEAVRPSARRPLPVFRGAAEEAATAPVKPRWPRVARVSVAPVAAPCGVLIKLTSCTVSSPPRLLLHHCRSWSTRTAM